MLGLGGLIVPRMEVLGLGIDQKRLALESNDIRKGSNYSNLESLEALTTPRSGRTDNNPGKPLLLEGIRIQGDLRRWSPSDMMRQQIQGVSRISSTLSRPRG